MKNIDIFNKNTILYKFKIAKKAHSYFFRYKKKFCLSQISKLTEQVCWMFSK